MPYIYFNHFELKIALSSMYWLLTLQENIFSGKKIKLARKINR